MIMKAAYSYRDGGGVLFDQSLVVQINITKSLDNFFVRSNSFIYKFQDKAMRNVCSNFLHFPQIPYR